MLTIPGRASDAGPEAGPCRNCGSKKWDTATSCPGCEGPVCDQCGAVGDHEIMHEECLMELAVSLLNWSYIMPEVELGALIGAKG